MLKSIAALALLAGLGQAWNEFSSFKDNECKEPLKLESLDWKRDGLDHFGLEIRNSITNDQRANGVWIDEVTFPDAAPSSQTGTQKKVYWSVPPPGRGCSYVLMKQFDRASEHNVVSNLNGEIIIIARKGGCYYSSLDDNTGFITTYCCGAGDCAVADLGTGLIAKREEPKASAIPAPKEERNALSPAAHASDMVRRDATIDIKSPSGTIKTAAVVGRDDPAPPSTCSVVSTSNADFKAVGRQIAITKVQQCGTGGSQEVPCTFAAGQEKTIETALSTEESYTLETGGGIEQSIGVDATFLGAGVTSTTTLSFSMSEAWTTTTGKEVTDGKASSTMNTLQQEPGTTAFLSYVPMYRCWEGRIRCTADNGNWHEGDQSYCVPEDAGWYSIVYTALGAAD
ncbi:hypothetical protein EJ04DRAFT_604113 [Polyplosphaeria fusca]|uniref:Uncharacterized protein n=1 Tax=Polyplosphaeria fusca TaxID=682080 RepID=A0A9P4UZ92_9PLEO|nr:hypothetical protein EJ04DRAFT_604113 [Polyplosphaeria fusca]